MSKEIELCRKDRLILSNQFRILDILEPNSKHDINAEIVERGYSYFYPDVFGPIGEGMSYAEGEFVMDVLAMYRDIILSYKNLSEEDKEEIDERSIKFQGFDSYDNEEHKLLSFADFIVRDMGLFPEILEMNKGDMSSMTCKSSKYRRMLTIWNGMEQESNDFNVSHLSKNMIKELVQG